MKQSDYSIGDTAKLTGATHKQIRHWEARGYIPTAGRIVSGERAYRRFTQKQIELIAGIKDYLEKGYTLPAAAEMAKLETLKQRMDELSGGVPNG